MTSKTETKDLVRYAIEALLIVLSVLLALFLDQRFEDRREARMAGELVGHIQIEMQRNLEIIDKWMPYHQDSAAKIDQYLNSPELQQTLLTDNGIAYLELMEDGILQELYSTSSWELAQQSEVTSTLDFELTHAMSKAYLSQDYVNQTIQRISDFFFDRSSHDPDEVQTSLRILRQLLRELAGQEYVLQQNYLEALERITG